MAENEQLEEQIVYQDQLLKVVLPSSAAVPGHLQVKPKKDINALADLSDEEVEHFFYTCSYSATLLFELIKAEGTNIIVNEKNGLVADVVARKSDDVLDFTWKPQELPEAEMSATLEKIKDGAFYIDNKEGKPKEASPSPIKEEKSPSSKEKDDKPEDLKQAEAKEDYMIKQLRKIP